MSLEIAEDGFCIHFMNNQNESDYIRSINKHILLEFMMQSLIKYKQQECIPVGSVPPAHWPYLVISATYAPCHACPPPCTLPPAMHSPMLCMPPCQACPCHARPPCHAPPLPYMPPCHTHPPPPWRTPPTPPVDRILDTRFWKYYLAPTSLHAVIN